MVESSRRGENRNREPNDYYSTHSCNFQEGQLVIFVIDLMIEVLLLKDIGMKDFLGKM